MIRTRKRRALNMIQRISGREKKPGTGAEPELVPEDRRGHEILERVISP